MYRTQRKRNARNFEIYHYEEQKEYNRENGVEKIQPHLEENDRSQRNKIKD